MEAMMQLHDSQPLAARATKTRARGKILIVDDEPRIRLALCSCLEAEGYEVEEARDGAEAIRVILDTRPDVMLLDLAMPHMDGMQTLHELRARYRDVMPRLVILTAWDSIADEEEAFLHGIADFIPKPVTPETVRRVVARALGASHDSDAININPASLADDSCCGENYLG